MILDSGALISAERNDRRVWVVLKEAIRRGVVLTVPSAALAQVWRGGKSARLAQLLRSCDVTPLDEALAKATGELCGRAGSDDIVDAAVVLTAMIRGMPVLTSDLADMRKLAPHAGGVHIIDIATV